MINKTIEDAFNEQAKYELFSAYLYLAMANYSDSIGLPGFAHWMQEQAKEEVEHAMKFINHIQDRGGKAILQAIDQPPSDFKSPLKMFENVLEHEQSITQKIHKLYDLALKENDYPAQVMLQWFIDEQVEEEKMASDIIDQLKLVGDQGASLLMMDRRLGARQS